MHFTITSDRYSQTADVVTEQEFADLCAAMGEQAPRLREDNGFVFDAATGERIGEIAHAYHITSKAGADHGIWHGSSEAHALAAMHREAGYDVEVDEDGDLTFASEDDAAQCGDVSDWIIEESLVGAARQTAILIDIGPTRATALVYDAEEILDRLDDMSDTHRVAYVPEDTQHEQRVWLAECEVIADPAAELA